MKTTAGATTETRRPALVAAPQPLTVETPMSKWIGFESIPRPGAVNPVPQADPTFGQEMTAFNETFGPGGHKTPPVSGVPGGPQQRYNPFTDGPPPVDSLDQGAALFMSGAFIFGVGVGLVFMVWVQ